MIKRFSLLSTLTLGISLMAFAPALAEPNENSQPAEINEAAPAPAPAPEENKPVKDNQPFSISPIVNPEAVANFPLDEAFLKKMIAVHQKLPSLPEEPDDPQYGNDTSITGLIGTIQYKPQLMKLLSDNGLTAQDYVIGTMALAASLAAASADGEDQFFDEANSVSPANLEFGKKHIDEIRVLLEE